MSTTEFCFYIPALDLLEQVMARLARMAVPFNFRNVTDGYTIVVEDEVAAKFVQLVIDDVMPPTGSLTDEMTEAYVMDGGKHCPYCHKEELDLEFDVEVIETFADGSVHVPVTCVGCGRRWMDLYTLVGIGPMQQADQHEGKGNGTDGVSDQDISSRPGGGGGTA